MERIFRSKKDRIIGGVCGGIGEYLNVDPVLIRLIAITLFLLGGITLLVYVLAWIIIPRKREDEPEVLTEEKKGED